AADAVGFAEDKARRGGAAPLRCLIANLPPQLDRAFQLPAKERLVNQLLRRPRVQPDANPAAAVVKTAGNEFSFLVEQIDRLTIQIKQMLVFDTRRLNPINGRSEDPRMAPIERQRLSRL